MIRTSSNNLKQSWGLSLGSSSWAANRIDSEVLNESRCVDSLNQGPPAVLLPRLPGEATRLDIWNPAHPRGSGDSWPAESIVNEEVGSGRMPLSAAWTARNQQDLTTENLLHRTFKWCWEIDGVSHELDPTKAIAEALAQISHRISPELAIAVTIPNNFRQQEQQLLIDFCRSRGTNITLLWSPVAAALAWLDRYETVLEALPDSRRTLLHVHVDWGATQFTELLLVAGINSNSRRWLPARSRPKNEDLIAGFGWLSESATLNSKSISSRWQAHLKEPKTEGFRYADGNETMLNALQGWEVAQTNPRDHSDAFKERLIQNPNKYAGVVVTGDFAAFKFEGTTTLESILSGFAPKLPGHSIVAPGLDGERELAKGAAIFSSYREQGIVTYLDTLPELDLFVENRGVFNWLPLLGQENEFVPGGQVWRREEPIQGLTVRRGSTSVRLVVAHEEFSGVREISAQLPESAEQRLTAELHVSAVAAQGNATLQLKLKDDTEIFMGEILADWRRMKPILNEDGSPIDKGTYLVSQPRAFPELMPRRNSRDCWNRVLPLTHRLIARMKSEGEQPKNLANDDDFLRDINLAVQQKDSSQYPNDATAIGSDFSCPGSQNDLDRFAEHMLNLCRYCIQTNASGTSLAVRVLGYISVDNNRFEDWLVTPKHHHFYDAAGSMRHSFGLCARDPHNIEKFVNRLFEKGRSLPRTDEMKAVSQILRYRAEATRELSPSLADSVMENSTKLFSRELDRGGRSFNFRWSSLVIVYILRRRMFDPNFAAPDGRLAMAAKVLFEKAIEACRSGKVRPIRGSVDVPAALGQMIDYIDKKGRGDILMSSD